MTKSHKCRDSPTGSHWWVITGTGQWARGVCKYCFRKRKFQVAYGPLLWDKQQRHAHSIRRMGIGKYKGD